MTQQPRSLIQAKRQAKQLRIRMAAEGKEISHSKSLELLAQQFGHRDWNGMSADLANMPDHPCQSGDQVTGQYLSQPFTADVISVTTIRPGWHRVTLKLHEAVDVVTFDSFSAFRQRITGTIGPDGTTAEKTTNGQPHLVLNL